MHPADTARIARAITASRRRLAAIGARRTLRARGRWVLLASCVVALSRPWTWPLADFDPLWVGAPRALGLGLLALVLLTVALYLVARRKPAALGAARILDEALGLREVVASGHALVGDEPVVRLARQRAAEAVHQVDVRAVLPLPRALPSVRGWFLGGFAVLVCAVLGGYDPALVRVLSDPPTIAELREADALQQAASALQELRDDTQEEADEEGVQAPDANPDLSERASQIGRDLARGNREQALARLQKLRSETHAREARARGLDRLARRLARHLESRSRTGDRRPSEPSDGELGESGSPRETNSERERTSPAEQEMRLLARQMRQPESAESAAERQRTLERLSRSADEARRNGTSAGQRLADALSRAAEALNRGARDEAAERLDEAAARTAELQRARERSAREAEALARLLERAGLLERSVQMAMLGEEGEPMMMTGEREGEGEAEGDGSGRRGLAAELAARLAAMGLAESPGPGPGGHQLRHGEPRSGLAPRGDLHASSRVREGERAVQMLEGLGANSEAATGYSDVYPSYDAIAEDALSTRDVPAARREAVRRYFELIRPGQFDETQFAETVEATPDTNAEPVGDE